MLEGGFQRSAEPNCFVSGQNQVKHETKKFVSKFSSFLWVFLASQFFKSVNGLKITLDVSFYYLQKSNCKIFRFQALLQTRINGETYVDNLANWKACISQGFLNWSWIAHLHMELREGSPRHRASFCGRPAVMTCHCANVAASWAANSTIFENEKRWKIQFMSIKGSCPMKSPVAAPLPLCTLLEWSNRG